MSNRIPVIREDDGELLGYVAKDNTSWQAQTIFGYVFARDNERAPVEMAVREQGLSLLQGLWQYFDKDDNAWHPCIIKEAYERRVVVIRTNPMGYQEPDSYKIVTITNPAETNLVKS